MKTKQVKFKQSIELELISDFDLVTEAVESTFERFEAGQIVDCDVTLENDGVFECQIPSGEVFYVTQNDVDFL